MPQERVERIIKAVERLGIASVICGALLWGCWQIISWTGPNVVKPLVDEQVEVMRWVRESGGKHDAIAAETSATLRDFTKELHGFRQDVKQIGKKLDRLVAMPGQDDKAVSVSPREPNQENN